jgi:hypothetical protein
MLRVLLGISIASSTFLTPLVVHAEDAKPTRADATPSARPAPRTITYDRNLPLKIGAIVAGTSFLAISYGLPCAKAGGHWCIPYGGPIVAAVKYNERESANAGDDESDEGGMIPPLFVDTLLVGVSAVQLLSTGLIVVGILIPRRDVTEPAYGFQLNRHVALTPVAAPSTVGLVASGNF